jgi:hypothetical protein
MMRVTGDQRRYCMSTKWRDAATNARVALQSEIGACFLVWRVRDHQRILIPATCPFKNFRFVDRGLLGLSPIS